MYICGPRLGIYSRKAVNGETYLRRLSLLGCQTVSTGKQLTDVSECNAVKIEVAISSETLVLLAKLRGSIS